MKKILFSLAAISSALMLNAQVYYLIPAADQNAAQVSSVNDYLPSETDGTVEALEVSPERRAYEWFADAEGFNGAGIVTLKDFTDGLVDTNLYKTIWINIDRVDFSLESFDAMFNDDVTAALETYVKNGGNLFVTKQAARLVSKILRTDWWPNQFSNGGYEDATDEWQMVINFCTEGNVEHECFKYMENGQSQDELEIVTRYPLVAGEGTYRRTNNNSAWGDWLYYLGDNGEGEPLYGGCDPLRRSTFEEHINGKVLGGWGHTRGMDMAGFIEFYPNEEYTGSVMAMGLAAYQWGAQNTAEYNVKNLTKGVLEYLTSGVTPAALKQTAIEHAATKSLVDGQVVILKNGLRYNALGQQMK